MRATSVNIKSLEKQASEIVESYIDQFGPACLLHLVAEVCRERGLAKAAISIDQCAESKHVKDV